MKNKNIKTVELPQTTNISVVCTENILTHDVTLSLTFKNSHIVGTKSIGYAIVDLNSHKQTTPIKTLNIFHTTTTPKEDIPAYIDKYQDPFKPKASILKKAIKHKPSNTKIASLLPHSKPKAKITNQQLSRGFSE